MLTLLCLNSELGGGFHTSTAKQNSRWQWLGPTGGGSGTRVLPLVWVREQERPKLGGPLPVTDSPARHDWWAAMGNAG